jgi:hypothetical protein
MVKKADWAKRVAAWRASGKSAREFCEGREYSPKRLQWWAWHLGRGERAVPREASVEFARVVRQRDADAGGRADSIVVQVGAARIEVGARADRAALAAVLDAVLAAAPGGRA